MSTCADVDIAADAVAIPVIISSDVAITVLAFVAVALLLPLRLLFQFSL